MAQLSGDGKRSYARPKAAAPKKQPATPTPARALDAREQRIAANLRKELEAAEAARRRADANIKKNGPGSLSHAQLAEIRRKEVAAAKARYDAGMSALKRGRL